ncbi:prephenate dehydrogenase [Candidatus Pseudothioglobus sp. Uisw_050_01]|uniref:prephenate dehydrogenase n=1 Tax=Candidatus Pseudothioglobus sp. Uisw_050_01 TaxID=3230997 RepID=UPI003A885118
MINKITIIGVGLIGGSLAKAIKENNLAKVVFGFGRDLNRLEEAQKANVIDQFSTNLKDAINDSDIVIIATPVGSFQEILSEIKPFLTSKIVISDVGSTKTNIASIVSQTLGDYSSYFIPAHPIAGKEKSGFEASESNLFNNRKVIITPLETSSPDSINLIQKMWEGTGADVDFMSPESHDELLGMTSHLPHMLAFSLVNYLISKNPSASIYAAGGFKDFSRIASGDAVMWRDICIQNKDQIIDHIRGYQKTLNSLVDAIENENSDELDLLFTSAKKTRDSWIG